MQRCGAVVGPTGFDPTRHVKFTDRVGLLRSRSGGGGVAHAAGGAGPQRATWRGASAGAGESPASPPVRGETSRPVGPQVGRRNHCATT